jgi:hypothetical protein
MRMRETVGHARELLTGNAILLEHNVGQFDADAEAISSYQGTREMNTLIVGCSITGPSALCLTGSPMPEPERAVPRSDTRRDWHRPSAMRSSAWCGQPLRRNVVTLCRPSRYRSATSASRTTSRP